MPKQIATKLQESAQTQTVSCQTIYTFLVITNACRGSKMFGLGYTVQYKASERKQTQGDGAFTSV